MTVLKFLKKLTVLMFGLFIFAGGILSIIHAGLGVSPWDTFHLGIIKHINLTLGQVSQVTGFMALILSFFLRQIPGWGTIANMYFIGVFIDIIENLQILPYPTGILGGLALLAAGILLIGWATFFYLNTAWGAGPKDALMMGLVKRFSIPVWVSRTILEVTVVIGGIILGVLPGMGTVVVALCVGPSIQLAYRIGKRDPKVIKHRTLQDDYKLLNSLFHKTGEYSKDYSNRS